jgi:two-component system LytT family response regulator
MRAASSLPGQIREKKLFISRNVGGVIMAQEVTDRIDVIIAEDDPLIRQLLNSYLSSFPRLNIVASAPDGLEAIDMADRLLPAAVFLDVEMPGLDGLSTAARLREQHPDIFIVFITAHARYAADAYQLEAVDYLIKPVTTESLARAVSKIEKFLALQAVGDGDQPSQHGRIRIKNDREVCYINLQDIVFIEKVLRKTLIHTEHGKYQTTETLSDLEARLGRNYFRCHKSFVVNLKKIEKVSPIAERIYKVTFYDYSESVTVGRQKIEELYRVLANC